MTTRINLAPEVYQTSQRNKRRKKLASTVAILVGVVCTAIVGVLILIVLSQKGILLGLQGSIDGKKEKLTEMSDLQAAVTLNDHLKTWNKLNDEKTYLSAFFNVLQDFSPQGVSVESLSIADDNTLEVKATAKTFALATKFAKALDAANVEIGNKPSDSNTPFFSGTELAAVSEDTAGVVSFKLTTKMSSEVTSGQN